MKARFLEKIKKKVVQYKKDNDPHIPSQNSALDTDIHLMLHTEDLVHEIKSLNKRMRDQVEGLLEAIQGDDEKKIAKTALGIENLCDLGNLRMELYEYLISPDSFESMADQGVSIYKEIERVYKSVNGGNSSYSRNFNLIGESWSRFKTKRIISVGLFIIIHNAWKYTLLDEPIFVKFNDNGDRLIVTIENWGPNLSDDEFPNIYQRHYRGKLAQQATSVGRGLGLNIAKRIFDICNVRLRLYIKRDSGLKYHNDILYSLFCAELTFSPLVQSYYNS